MSWNISERVKDSTVANSQLILSPENKADENESAQLDSEKEK